MLLIKPLNITNTRTIYSCSQLHKIPPGFKQRKYELKLAIKYLFRGCSSSQRAVKSSSRKSKQQPEQ